MRALELTRAFALAALIVAALARLLDAMGKPEGQAPESAIISGRVAGVATAGRRGRRPSLDPADWWGSPAAHGVS